MMPTVQVLMSTYNGDRYLHQQIESILRQEGVEVELLVRDDGSTDHTTEILDDYQRQGLLRWYSGENLGPARSFLQLLSDAPHADFYAFSDQDDVWQSDKLRAAVKLLNGHAAPALYFCQTQLVDEDLNPKLRQIPISPLLTYGESLVYQFIGGCTMVMNNELRDAVCGYTPSVLYMHDVWIYSVCLAIGGKVFFDPESHILYRQHSQNAIGQGNRLREWQRRWKRISGGEQARYKTALELRDGYNDAMPAENRQLTDDYIKAKTSFFTRLRLLCDPRLATSNASTSRIFKLALLLGTY